MYTKSLIQKGLLASFMIIVFLTTLNSQMIMARDIIAASCSATDIQQALEKCISTGGGTTYIPECNADNTWGNSDYIKITTDTTFQLKGAGMEATIIGYQDNSRHSPGFFFKGTGLVELSDFTFRGPDSVGMSTGIRIFANNSENLRIHHLKLQKFKTTALYLCQNPTGQIVIDHCVIGDQYGRYMYGIRCHGTNNADDFIVPPSFGMDNPNACFIEDCNFDRCYHSVSGFSVSNIVFRYNSVTHPTSYVDAHGPCFDIGCSRSHKPPYTGTYIFEAYNNTITRSNWCINIRGGCGIVTDNTFIKCKPGMRLEMEKCSRDQDCSLENGCPYSTVDPTKCYQSPKYWWIWNNTCNGCGFFDGEFSTDGDECIRKDHEYFLSPKPGYIKYTYPHPFVSDETLYTLPSVSEIKQTTDPTLTSISSTLMQSNSDEPNWQAPISVLKACDKSHATKLVDKNISSIWHHWKLEKHWVILDLGASYTVKRILIYHKQWSTSNAIAAIYVSENTTDWGNSLGSSPKYRKQISGWKEADIKDKKGRYIKIVSEKVKSPYWHEFDPDIEDERKLKQNKQN